MKKRFTYLFLILSLSIFSFGFKSDVKKEKTNPPIYIAFLWHMHQPIYWPYENIIQTDLNNRYPYSVVDIHNQRTGPYTNWPKNAIQNGINAGLSHLGAQVSFSGSLIENLNNLEAAGNQNFQNWKSHWNYIKNQKTSLNNPRIDLVGFGYHHPLMGLIDYIDIRKQIQEHKKIFQTNFPGAYSKGIFPPENAFSPRMIPALVDEGFEWVLVDNIHFDRACSGYPFSTAGNIYEANKADVLNPNPNDWVQLNGLWAPTKNSARWGRQPHYVEYVNPATGVKSKIIAVPCDRYMGNEDGRGGFGALNYENVMSQLESFNTDPNHPILIVLHHDGDNYGGGSSSYYGNNFSNFISWLQANPNRFVCTTIQDYLQMFPPDPNDVIHIEDGSWSGADNGDPEFKKWNGDPNSQGYSADRNSWGVITAAKNFVLTAENIDPNNPNTLNAWKYLLNGEASDYWYWDGSMNGIWDSHPTRAANVAVQYAKLVSGADNTPPTIYLPQRKPYNPGGTEWGINQPRNFKVWSYVFDKSGLKSVKLKYRLDLDGINPLSSIQNETYAGGNEVGEWMEIDMTGTYITPQTNPMPLYKALEYSAEITDLMNKYVDYYIEAVDSLNNIGRSPIRHVWVGEFNSGSSGNYSVTWSPANATKNDTITITVTAANKMGKLHWGVNNWITPNNVYWPQGTVLFNGTGPAVQTPFSNPDTAGNIFIQIGPFNKPNQSVQKVDFVISYNDGSWDNNNGNDYHIQFSDSSTTQGYVMDGQIDVIAKKVFSDSNNELYLHFNGNDLYIATKSAKKLGNDVFIFVSDSLRALVNAPWVKNGQVCKWNLYLGNESSNNWSGWFEQKGTVQSAAGQDYLEGVVNILSNFSYTPSKIYISVGIYQTNDGGNLVGQILPSKDGNGNINANEFYAFDYTFTSIKNEKTNYNFHLAQNYPNPFNPVTVIQYEIPSNYASQNMAGVTQDFVQLKIYDMLGREIETLVNKPQAPGKYSIEWNAGKYSSGIYYYELRVGEFHSIKKMMFIK